MVSRITAALAARYKAIQEKEKGFTLIELLVVVIIIGVLAAIAIPIYIGVQESAKDSSVKSDLGNAKIAVVAYNTDGGTPLAAGDLALATLDDYGMTKGVDTASLTYSLPTGFEFCIVGTRTGGAGANTFNVTDSTGVLKGNTCGVNTP